MHVFNAPELKITLSESVQYAAVRSTACGAPFRAVTVRDTIGDLPAVGNGASKSTLEVFKIQKVSLHADSIFFLTFSCSTFVNTVSK